MSATVDSPFSIRMPLYWLGVLLFFINIETDERFGIPASEFILFGFILLQYMLHRSILNLTSLHITALLILFLVAWVTVVDYYHTPTSGEAVRVMLRNVLFYGIIIGYLYLPDKRPMFLLMLGLVSGYVLNFFHESFNMFITQPETSYYQLKYIIPAPGILALILLGYRRQLPGPVLYLLLGCILYSIPAMLFIGSRGAFMSLFIGLLAYGIARYVRPPRWLIILAALSIPLIPVIIVSLAADPSNPMKLAEMLFALDYATHSNVERILMLTMSLEIMKDDFLLGIGRYNMVPMVEPYFVHLSGLKGMAAESPHNYYLEFSVPFGVPAMLLIIGIFSQLYRFMFIAAKQLNQPAGIASCAMFLTSWIMLYQPVAGITRVDIFIIMITALYGMQNPPFDNTPEDKAEKNA